MSEAIVDTYLDGGTVVIKNDVHAFFIDQRIGTFTKGAVFYGAYPGKTESKIVDSAEEIELFVQMTENVKTRSENEEERIREVRERFIKFLEDA